ncbi:leucyl aminopeptidase [Cruoricaptor ignavus]|uniref:Leucyl aminopeptidase n=1 Tax=Cruoricaptor ignavus TaxID=1118202 RepID=A0A1M6CD63_9FLAO|nr:leucyl aminopeptidase family protein [Cruoricaptor ignavus]SHI58751.1 leucyl aminopeptidase [Cruoricaptor ignavus]
MIKISNSQNTDYQQIIKLFTEKTWQEFQADFPNLSEQFFSGKKGEEFIVINENGQSVFLLGFGESIPHDADLQKSAKKFSWQNRKKFTEKPTEIQAKNFTEENLKSFARGLFLGTYHYPFERSHPFWKEGFSLNLKNFSDEKIAEISTEINAICEGQFAAMDWLNKPANFKKVPQISEFIKNISEKYGIKYTAYNSETCAARGLGAFLAVNQGSKEEGAFTILEYQGEYPEKTVGLVGKCVLFDTGGISLKNPENMHYMKSDLGGATAVLGTLIAAAEMKLPVKIIAILPITDNAISENAYLPSDVVAAYNGKTIEVLNTDAEGRMTLADGLAYLTKNYETDCIIDVATLTGSTVRMFGETCAAIMGNDDDLIKSLMQSGEETGQRLWQLPLWEIWDEEIKSDVADLRNISMKPIGDAIVAGKFLQHFVENGAKWAHLDIAGMAFGKVDYAKEKAATGYGVQLLLNFLKKP